MFSWHNNCTCISEVNQKESYERPKWFNLVTTAKTVLLSDIIVSKGIKISFCQRHEEILS